MPERSRPVAEPRTRSPAALVAVDLGERSAHELAAQRRRRAATAHREHRSAGSGAASVCAARCSACGPMRSGRATPRARRRGSRDQALVRTQRGAVVAAEEFVGALAGEGDGDVLGGELAEGEEAERREVGEGFVEVPDEFGEVESLRREG